MKRKSRAWRITVWVFWSMFAVIVLGGAFLMNSYEYQIRKSKEAVLRENLRRTRSALKQFHEDKGRWPVSLQEIVDEQYLRALPIDPITESPDSWTFEPPTGCDEPDCGVRNLSSGAPGNGLDGNEYSSW